MMKYTRKYINCLFCNKKLITTKRWCNDNCERLYRKIPFYCQNPNCIKGENGNLKKLIRVGQSLQKKTCSRECGVYFAALNNTGRTRKEGTGEKIGKALRGIKHTEEFKKKVSDGNKKAYILDITLKDRVSHKKENHHFWNIKSEDHPMFGKKHSEETKQKMRENRPDSNGKNNGFYGKHHSEETKTKFRINSLNAIIETGRFLRIGNNEIQLLDKQEVIDNCIINRNFTVIGYKPDGYCFETNTIYEVYEPGHKRCKNKDIVRQKRIQEHLKCKFVIIYDRWYNNKTERFNYENI